MDEARAARLFRDANEERWDLAPSALAEALERSVAKAFAGRTPSAGETDRYLATLHLADLALACACARGHEAAWDHFVAEYRPILYRAADAVDTSGGAREVADALYAELFGIKERDGQRQSLFRYFHGRSSLGTWLRTLVAQRYVDRIREVRRHDPIPEETSVGVLPAPAQNPDPDRPRFAAAMSAVLAAVLAQLAPRDRLRLGCYYAQEMTLAQIGRLTGEHEATVSRHLTRTRREIRSLVERRLREEHQFADREIGECFASLSTDAGSIQLSDWLDPDDDRKKAGVVRSSTGPFVNAERDRDRLLENALKHQLRSAGAAPASDACLDAETISAWMDGGLDPQAAAMAEAHAANCARCQALLGSVAHTTPAVAPAEPHRARLWRWWLAPLAATAAAATVWMVVPQDRLTAPPVPSAVESAPPQSTAPATPGAEVAITQSAPAPSPLPAQPRANVGVERAGARADRAEPVAPKREAQSFEARERQAEIAKPADATAAGRVAAMAPAPPAAAPAPPAVSSPAAPAAAQRKQLDPVADATARSSPSPNVIWLVGLGGAVHLATDGVTFMRLPFPEAVDLTAITASDERRATVTARDGRVFETADGGQTWQRRP